MSWEDTFRVWGRSPSATEIQKCENAENAVRKAIQNSTHLDDKTIRVFPQGSYRNRTNIGAESDVDVAVLCTDTFFYKLPDGYVHTHFGIITPAPYQHSDYKKHLQAALHSHFGESSVKKGNKAFDIHENTYRVDADVVPCFEYRLYDEDGNYRTGTSFLTDDDVLIVNWPDQNYTNGVAKNDATNQRFKAITRTLKNLRVKMANEGVGSAKPIPSYLIECLVWNVPNPSFNSDTSYTSDVRNVLAHLFNNTMKIDDCMWWTEVNDIKYLFRDSQPWTLTQAHRFISDAWDYIGFE